MHPPTSCCCCPPTTPRQLSDRVCCPGCADTRGTAPPWGCVNTGALIFPKAGLLESAPAAAHHEALPAYRALHGDALFADRLFDLSGASCSSAGDIADFDMTLALIERHEGSAMAARIAEILCYRPTRHPGPQQRMLVDTSILRLDRRLAGAVEQCSPRSTGRWAPLSSRPAAACPPRPSPPSSATTSPQRRRPTTAVSAWSRRATCCRTQR